MNTYCYVHYYFNVTVSRIKRKNIVRIMSSKNIDDARRLLREKRSMDSMMSFLLENNSSTKKKLLKT